jgi:hypothetical protein
MESDVPDTRITALIAHTPAASDTATLFFSQMGGLSVPNEHIWRIKRGVKAYTRRKISNEEKAIAMLEEV